MTVNLRRDPMASHPPTPKPVKEPEASSRGTRRSSRIDGLTSETVKRAAKTVVVEGRKTKRGKSQLFWDTFTTLTNSTTARIAESSADDWPSQPRASVLKKTSE
jgi:hypothetical protein